MHDDTHKLVVVIKIGFTEVNFGTVNDWFKISHICAFKLTVNVEIKVMEF